MVAGHIPARAVTDLPTWATIVVNQSSSMMTESAHYVESILLRALLVRYWR